MPFKSRRQRETFFGRLKVNRETFPVFETRNYFVVRVRPRAKGTFRILDVGKPKRHQLLRVRTKKGWVTRSIRVQKGIRGIGIGTKTTQKIIKRAITRPVGRP